ncbi:MAG: glycosyl transferase family 2 [Actinomycetia bacterium]|nr:glycosyl transferase family 2 [Actinomycetes bacterium]
MNDLAVSVVIPLYGGAEHVGRCLESLTAHTDVPHEVIVVDNASPDDAAEVAESFSGVEVVRNATNVGFGEACNQGAQLARAPRVCLLNSDAFVEPGWLPPLLETLDGVPGALAAVPMFLEPDGRLQEAGALLSRDGRGVLYGNGDDPSRLRYRFRRAVDYGSGACFLMWRDAFLTVGGFDPVYGLAYYEDADLALRWRSADRYVVYEPRSQVVHVRNGSMPAGGALAGMKAANQAEFRQHFTEVLSRRPPLDDLEQNPHRLLAARDADLFDRLLLLTDAVPEPDSPVGRVLLALARDRVDARVTVLITEPVSADDPRVATLLAAGVEVGDGHDDWYGWLRDRVAMLSIVVVHGSELHDRFDRILRAVEPQALRVHWRRAGERADSEAEAAADEVIDDGLAEDPGPVLGRLGWAMRDRFAGT